MPATGKTQPRKSPAGKATKAGGTPIRTSSRRELPEVGTLYRPIKKPVTLRLDADVLAWFRTLGPGYQTRINTALRRIMLEQGKKGPR